jgi:hypothetical protein
MRFVIDLDSLELIQSASDRRRVSQVEGKRGDDSPFEVSFVRSGVAEELPALTVLTFGAKQTGKYDVSPVVLHNDFTLSGTGITAKYLGNPSYSTVGLDALFNIDDDAENDVPFVDLMAEFSWQVGAGAPTSTRTFTLRMHNDVIRDETSPTPLPSPIGSTTPINEVAATLTVDPTGADNSVLWTAAVGQGADGNDITVAYASPTATHATTAAIAADAITVTPGTKARMVVSGVSTGSVNGELEFGEFDAGSGRPVYTTGGVTLVELGSNAGVTASWSGGQWTVRAQSLGGTTTYRAQCTSTATYPDGLTFDAPVTGSGTPTVTAATSSAAQVIAAANAAPSVAARVTASASGTVTGAVAAVTAANLTGGVDGTASPPFLRVAGGFLYVQEAGVWKKTALSAL